MERARGIARTDELQLGVSAWEKNKYRTNCYCLPMERNPNPKSDARNKSEIRNPKRGLRGRTSDFGLHMPFVFQFSNVGFRALNPKQL